MLATMRSTDGRRQRLAAVVSSVVDDRNDKDRKSLLQTGYALITQLVDGCSHFYNSCYNYMLLVPLLQYSDLVS